MPFRSEKQRRFLWAKHPEIAKEWAHKYPESNKGLPMYAHENKEDDKPVSKEAALNALKVLVVNNLNQPVKSVFTSSCDKNTKKANSKLEHIKLPQDDKPTYAGERKLESILKPETEDEGSIGETRNVNSAENNENMQSNPLLSKLAVVLAPKIQQEIENIRAQQEAREANRTPQNVNIKRYPVVNNTVPPPMGMTAAPQAPQAPQQPAQPQNGQMAPVGGGQSPNANPINSFGGLSSTGDINGNAAMGTQNMAGGEKMAAQKCSCGCGDTPETCKCPPNCSCRQKGGSCYGLKKQAGGNNSALAKLVGISSDTVLDPAEIDELEDEMCSYNEKLAAIGLWDRIRAKKKRGEKPAKPGDKDYPDAKSWDKVTAISEKKADNSLYTPSEDVLTRAFENFRATYTGDAAATANKIDSARFHVAGGTYNDPARPNADKLSPALPYVIDAVYRAGQEKGDPTLRKNFNGLQHELKLTRTEADQIQKNLYDKINNLSAWTTNPRLWAGVGIGAGGVLGAYGLKKLYDRYRRPKQEKQSGSPAWQRSEGKNEEGGLNEKGRKSYEREHGGNLKAPVTESNPSGERAKRQNSFCSRMCGMKRVNTGASTAKDPDSRINKSLRKWNCKCSSAREFGEKLGHLLHWA